MAIILSKPGCWPTLVCLCCAGFVFGISGPGLPDSQEPAAQSAEASTLHVDVDVVLVDAIVLDKRGDPIRNLEKSSFHLFEDGREQEIASFEEVTGAPGGEIPVGRADVDGGRMNRGKTVLILFDDSHITGAQDKIARDSAEKYVKDHMKPQDLFAVASFGVALKILQNFTRQPAKVLEAIQRPRGLAEPVSAMTASTTSAASRDSQRQGRFQELQPNTLSAYQIATYRAAPLLQSLDELNLALAQIRGRKAVLLYSEDFSASANIHGDFKQAVNSARRGNIAFYTIDARGLNSAEGGGVTNVGQQSTTTVGNPRARPTRSGSDIDWAQFDRIPMENILRPLARETDGVAIYNTSDINQLLDEVDKELSNYYQLGFQSKNPIRDGKFRTLDVKVDVKGATVKHRNGYVDRRPLDALASSKEERILIEAMRSQTPAAKMSVTLQGVYVYESSTLVRVPIAAKIRAESIEIKKKGGQLTGDLNIMGIAYAEGGTIAARFSEIQHVLIDKGQEAAFRNRSLVYRNYFKLRPGRYLLKLAISDAQGKVGTAEQSLSIPALPQSSLASSSLIVADQVFRMPDLIQDLQTRQLEENDPLTFNGLQVSPSAETQFPLAAPLQVFFKLYNLSGTPEQRKLLATVRLLDESGREIQSLPPTPLDQNVFITGKSEAMVGFPLLLDKARAGKCRLLVETSESTSKQSVTIQSDLQFR